MIGAKRHGARPAGVEAAADVAWDGLATSERVAVVFKYMEGAVGAPQAFKFLARVWAVASKGGHGDCPAGKASASRTFLSASCMLSSPGSLAGLDVLDKQGRPPQRRPL